MRRHPVARLLAPLSAVPISYGLRRIIARVDQLMSLCDKLEARLLRSQEDSERSNLRSVVIICRDCRKTLVFRVFYLTV